jgi:hypothetical protein
MYLHLRVYLHKISLNSVLNRSVVWPQSLLRAVGTHHICTYDLYQEHVQNVLSDRDNELELKTEVSFFVVSIKTVAKLSRHSGFLSYPFPNWRMYVWSRQRECMHTHTDVHRRVRERHTHVHACRGQKDDGRQAGRSTDFSTDWPQTELFEMKMYKICLVLINPPTCGKV